MNQLYRMLDADPVASGCLPTSPVEASRLNTPEHGWGVYIAVNEFKSWRRTIANLARVCAWAIEVDGSNKAEQEERIRQSPLVPSRVVESKAGFHVWFFSKDGTASTWNDIMLDRLVPAFGADPRARDLARVLRMPGYLHLKDPADPFLVREVHRWDVAYTEVQMLDAFPDAGREARERKERAAQDRAVRAGGAVEGEDFWTKVYSLDCRYALEKLSGHWSVKSERFEFKENRSGTCNILVDDGGRLKSTSCWIDRAGKIGSADRGGPSIGQWLRWYGHSYSDVARILRDLFPELR